LGHLVTDLVAGNFFSEQRALKILAGITGAFVTFMLIAAILGDQKYISFIGDNQRNTGWIDYFFLAIFLYTAAKHIRISNISMIYWFGIGVGAVMTEYGLLQHFGHDFVKWNNPYNSIISTVGNPDFAGGVMALFLTFSVVSALVAPWKLWVRGLIGIQAVLTVLVINWSQARQGLLSFGLGLGIFFVVWIWQKNRRLGQLAALGAIFTFVVALAGIFQVGPLTKYLYKSSVTVRGFYWRAGVDMFIHHPWFGVGPDRYGVWFRNYRSPQYPVNYGLLTSTAAHNVVIQIFATCGIFVGVAYLSLLGFVLYRGAIAIKRNSGKNRLLVAGLLAAWVGYQSQSIVSIDNIGIAIWGWVVSGLIIGISLVELPASNANSGQALRRQINSNIFKPVISSAVVLSFLFLVIPMYRGESNTFHLSAYAVPTAAQGQATRDAYHQLVLADLSVPLLNPEYRIMMASDLAQAGYVDEGFTQLALVLKKDSRNYEALSMQASFYEQLHQFDKAVKSRLRMYSLDPWGYQNLGMLGTDYLSLGNKAAARDVGQKILNIGKLVKPAPTSAYITAAQQARTILGA